MENKYTVREYNEAVKRILKKEGLKKVEEANNKNFRERLNEISDRILKGEMDTEIENEIKLLRKEKGVREER